MLSFQLYIYQTPGVQPWIFSELSKNKGTPTNISFTHGRKTPTGKNFGFFFLILKLSFKWEVQAIDEHNQGIFSPKINASYFFKKDMQNPTHPSPPPPILPSLFRHMNTLNTCGLNIHFIKFLKTIAERFKIDFSNICDFFTQAAPKLILSKILALQSFMVHILLISEIENNPV